MADVHPVCQTVATIVASRRLPFGDEIACQDVIASLLTTAAIAFEREYRLGPRNRIDFYLPASKVGIEVKVQGSPSDVLRQLERYALSDAIAALMLVTGRRTLSQLPTALHGKPLVSVATWRGGL